MKNFNDKECERQTKPIAESGIFDGIPGGGRFIGKKRPFVLADGVHNLYAPIRDEVQRYFKDNGITWWGGFRPTGHVLSSQITTVH